MNHVGSLSLLATGRSLGLNPTTTGVMGRSVEPLSVWWPRGRTIPGAILPPGFLVVLRRFIRHFSERLQIIYKTNEEEDGRKTDERRTKGSVSFLGLSISPA